MREIQAATSSVTQDNMQSSSESARANRKKHKDRATLDMESTIEIEEARLHGVDEELQRINGEIDCLV